MSKDNFDFSGYPKLGRPFVSGSKRDKYLKFYVSQDELNNFEKSEKTLNVYFHSKGYHYNRPAFMRFLLLNICNLKFLDLLFDHLSDEIKNNFKIN